MKMISERAKIRMVQHTETARWHEWYSSRENEKIRGSEFQLAKSMVRYDWIKESRKTFDNIVWVSIFLDQAMFHWI